VTKDKSFRETASDRYTGNTAFFLDDAGHIRSVRGSEGIIETTATALGATLQQHEPSKRRQQQQQQQQQRNNRKSIPPKKNASHFERSASWVVFRITRRMTRSTAPS